MALWLTFDGNMPRSLPWHLRTIVFSFLLAYQKVTRCSSLRLPGQKRPSHVSPPSFPRFPCAHRVRRGPAGWAVDERNLEAPSLNSRPRFRVGISSIISRIRRSDHHLAAEHPPVPVVPFDELDRVKNENVLLRQALAELQAENEQLQRKISRNIVLETFEGEGRLMRSGGFELSPYEDALLTSPANREDMSLWCDELEDDACPVEPQISFGEALRDRAFWLVGLLILQSFSGIILAQNEALLVKHPVIVYFLTMLVGAGGNAGNQASVRVIRGLALGTLNDKTQSQFLTRELKMAGSLSGILSFAGFLRAAAFRTPFAETVAVTASLGLIVFSSICLGALLPLLLKRVGVDPAHSSTTIQVVMDILGVFLALVVSTLLLDSRWGAFLISRLSGGT